MIAAEYDVSFETNSEGLRDDEIGPKTSSPRILLLGDSFTCGQGARREDLFADLLEKKLDVEVVNAGVSGFQIIHQYNYFRTTGKSFNSDLVVYALYLGNDLTRNDEWTLNDHGDLTGAGTRWPVRAVGESKLYAMLRWLKYSYRSRHDDPSIEWRPPPDYLAKCRNNLDEKAVRDYRRAKDLIVMLRDEIAASGAKFFIVMFPFKTAVEFETATAGGCLRRSGLGIDGPSNYLRVGRWSAFHGSRQGRAAP